MATTAAELLSEVSFAMDLARTDLLLKVRDEIMREEKVVDVGGYWKGYDSDGMGLVEYRGRIYICKVLARKCKQLGALVNLRRTPNGNYVNWA